MDLSLICRLSPPCSTSPKDIPPRKNHHQEYTLPHQLRFSYQILLFDQAECLGGLPAGDAVAFALAVCADKSP